MHRLRPIAFWAGINLLFLLVGGAFIWNHWNGSTRLAVQAPPPEPISYDGELGLAIFAHDEKTDARIAGAFVYTMDVDNLPPEVPSPISHGGYQGWYQYLRDYGQKYVTDQHGHTRVPRYGTDQLVLVEKGGYSSLASRRELNQKWFYLKPNRRFKIRVVDQLGKPVAHAPLALQFRTRDHYSVGFTFWSASNGIASLENLDELDLAPDWRGHPCIAFFGVGAQVKEPKDSFVLLTQRVLDCGEATLRIPPTGSVKIELLDSDQKHLLPPGYVTIKAIAFGDNLEKNPDLYRNGSHRSKDGNFEFVALGARLSLEFSYSGYTDGFHELIEFNGPTKAGQILPLKVQFGLPEYWEGKLLDQSGEPLALKVLEVREFCFTSDRILEDNVGIRTDEKGRFRTKTMRMVQDRKAIRRVLALQTQLNGTSEQLYSQIEIDLESVIRDLGEIRMKPFPLAASGKLISDLPTDLEYVGVRLKLLDKQSSKPGSPLFLSSRGRVRGDGSFQIHAVGPSEGKYQLTVKGNGYSPRARWEGFKLGDTGIEIPISPSGEFFLHLLTDPGIDKLSLPMKYEHEGSNEVFNMSIYWKKAKSEGTTWLASGPIHSPLHLMVKSAIGEIVLESRDKTFGIPQSKNLLHFYTLDLRGKLKQVCLELKDPEGLRVSGNLIVHTKNHVGEADIHNGIRNIVTRDAITKTEISAKGFKDLVIHNVIEDRVVHLVPLSDNY